MEWQTTGVSGAYDMKYNGVIDKKLKLLEKKILEIESWEIDDLAVLQGSSLLSNALERGLQVSVEIMIDVSERILAIEKLPPGDGAADNMSKLGELGVLKNPEIYMNMVRFRNFIVHRYEYIETDIIYDIAKNKLGLFRQFASEVYNS